MQFAILTTFHQYCLMSLLLLNHFLIVHRSSQLILIGYFYILHQRPCNLVNLILIVYQDL